MLRKSSTKEEIRTLLALCKRCLRQICQLVVRNRSDVRDEVEFWIRLRRSGEQKRSCFCVRGVFARDKEARDEVGRVGCRSVVQQEAEVPGGSGV